MVRHQQREIEMTTILSTTARMGVDARFSSPSKQAAKALGVTIKKRGWHTDVNDLYHRSFTDELGNVRSSRHWYVQAFETTDGNALVVYSDDDGLTASLCAGFDWDGSVANSEQNYKAMAVEAGIWTDRT